jgi:hypothetical protein
MRARSRLRASNANRGKAPVHGGERVAAQGESFESDAVGERPGVEPDDAHGGVARLALHEAGRLQPRGLFQGLALRRRSAGNRRRSGGRGRERTGTSIVTGPRASSMRATRRFCSCVACSECVGEYASPSQSRRRASPSRSAIARKRMTTRFPSPGWIGKMRVRSNPWPIHSTSAGSRILHTISSYTPRARSAFIVSPVTISPLIESARSSKAAPFGSGRRKSASPTVPPRLVYVSVSSYRTTRPSRSARTRFDVRTTCATIGRRQSGVARQLLSGGHGGPHGRMEGSAEHGISQWQCCQGDARAPKTCTCPRRGPTARPAGSARRCAR